MHRIFLPLYHFFRKHKVLMYLLLIASTLLFGYYGLQLEYEENIVKLLPRSSTDNELAFSDIGLKDKVFLQITSKDTLNPVEPARLGEAMEEFCGMLEKQDEETRYIAAIAGSFPSTSFGTYISAASVMPYRLIKVTLQ